MNRLSWLLVGLALPAAGEAQSTAGSAASKAAAVTQAPPLTAQADSMERIANRFRMTAAWAPPPGKTQQQYQENEEYRAWKRKWSDVLAKAAAQRRTYLAKGVSDERSVQKFNDEYLALQRKLQQESQRYTSISNVMKTKQDTPKKPATNAK